MLKNRCYVFCFFLFSVLLLGFSWEIWAEDFSETEKNRTQSSETALNRLIEISTQLSALNEKLQNELQISRQSSSELQNMLKASRKELDELKTELEVLRETSVLLLTKAENSQMELTDLLLVLRKADSSLMSLDLSFTAYKQTAEKQIKNLNREKTLWKWGCIAAGGLAAGFGTAFLISR